MRGTNNSTSISPVGYAYGLHFGHWKDGLFQVDGRLLRNLFVVGRIAARCGSLHSYLALLTSCSY